MKWIIIIIICLKGREIQEKHPIEKIKWNILSVFHHLLSIFLILLTFQILFSFINKTNFQKCQINKFNSM